MRYGPIYLLYTLLIWNCSNQPIPEAGKSRPTDSLPETPIVDTTDLTAGEPPEGWIDLGQTDPTILLDIRYATTDNFVSEQMYPCPRCLLRQEAAKKLIALQKELQLEGLGLKVFDCYRPRPVQQLLWDKVPNASYVTPPDKGSMHNRGVAVDVTLVVRSTGEELPMGTDYDYFGAEAHHTHLDLAPDVLENRKYLKERMASMGFKHIRTEWWHYSYTTGSYAMADFVWDCP